MRPQPSTFDPDGRPSNGASAAMLLTDTGDHYRHLHDGNCQQRPKLGGVGT